MQDTLEAIVARIPPPTNTVDKELRALIFDSYYDPYRWVWGKGGVGTGEEGLGSFRYCSGSSKGGQVFSPSLVIHIIPSCVSLSLKHI